MTCGFNFLLVGAVVLAACESDAAKLQRLQREHGTADLEVWYYQKRIDSLYEISAMLLPDKYPSHKARSDSVRAMLDSLLPLKADAELRAGRAEVAIRKLMGG